MQLTYSFYDKLFLYYYNLKKNSDNTPQYFPIIILSTVQSVNIFLCLTLIFYIFKIQFSALPECFLILYIRMLIFNFYLYQIKDRKEIILKKNIKLSSGFKVCSYFYFAISFISPLILIFFLQEH
jgi:C4-dicarboxylate transporter